MRKRVCAALAVCLIAAGCGSGSGGAAPQGNPDARRGTTAVDDYAAVELMRAKIIASSDGYYGGGSVADARTQLARARSDYDVLAPRVRAKDPVVDREVSARFNLLARALSHRLAPDHYRDEAGPLSDQLMDGVSQALVPDAARSDRGVQAEALRRVATRMSATYDAAAGLSDASTTRLAFQESWGLWRRAQALTSLIKGNLGGAKDTVSNTLNDLRGSAFPDGPTLPSKPEASTLDSADNKIIDAITRRFGFSSVPPGGA